MKPHFCNCREEEAITTENRGRNTTLGIEECRLGRIFSIYQVVKVVNEELYYRRRIFTVFIIPSLRGDDGLDLQLPNEEEEVQDVEFEGSNVHDSTLSYSRKQVLRIKRRHGWRKGNGFGLVSSDINLVLLREIGVKEQLIGSGREINSVEGNSVVTVVLDKQWE